MTRTLFIAVGIAILLPATAGAAPTITFDPFNPSIDYFTKGPVARTWKWTCSDPAKVFPLSLRCQVYDITNGIPGTGKAVKISDVACGSGSANPVKVTYKYNVASPKADHRYMYVAQCHDSKKCGGIAGDPFWYDITPPVSTIHSGPPKVSSSSTVTFKVSCNDNSFKLTTAPLAPLTGCANYTKLVNTDTNMVIKPTTMSGVFFFNYKEITVIYTGLTPGAYRFETYAEDEAGNVGKIKDWAWGSPKLDSGVKKDTGTKKDSGGKKDTGAKLDTGGKKDTGTKKDSKDTANEAGVNFDSNGGSGDGQADEAGSGKGKDGGGGGNTDVAGGCDCRTAAGGAPHATLMLLLLLGLVLRRRR